MSMVTFDGCSGDDFEVIVNDITYNESNPSGSETLTAVNGCDSIVTIDLNFRDLPLNPIIEPITLCFGGGGSTEIIPSAGPPVMSQEFGLTWDFEGEVLTAASTIAAVVGMDASQGGDLGNFTFPGGADGSSDALSTNNWNDEAGDFFEFCFTPTENILIDSIAFFDQASGTGPDMFTVLSSHDGFSSPILSSVTHSSYAQSSASNLGITCLLYTSPSPRDQRGARMPSSA